MGGPGSEVKEKTCGFFGLSSCLRLLSIIIAEEVYVDNIKMFPNFLTR